MVCIGTHCEAARAAGKASPSCCDVEANSTIADGFRVTWQALFDVHGLARVGAFPLHLQPRESLCATDSKSCRVCSVQRVARSRGAAAHKPRENEAHACTHSESRRFKYLRCVGRVRRVSARNIDQHPQPPRTPLRADWVGGAWLYIYFSFYRMIKYFTITMLLLNDYYSSLGFIVLFFSFDRMTEYITLIY